MALSKATKIGMGLGALAGAAWNVVPGLAAYIGGLDSLLPAGMDMPGDLNAGIDANHAAVRSEVSSAIAGSGASLCSFETFKQVLVGTGIGALGGGLLVAGINWVRGKLSGTFSNSANSVTA